MASTTYLTLATVALAITHSAVAQTVINYSALPQCAPQCALLTQAQAVCVPPAAAVTNQQTYQQCFCQSAYLTQWYSSAADLCNGVCNGQALGQIQSWYVGLCKSGQVQSPSSTLATSTSATVSASTSGLSSAAGAAATQSASTNVGGGNFTNDQPQGSWMSTHWKWVVMLIVIFIGLILLSIIGVFLKRRYNRIQDERRANVAATGVHVPPPPVEGSRNHDFAMSGGQGAPKGPEMAAVAIPPPTAGSRTNTMGSLRGYGSRNASRTHVAEPVVWGPHQHQAHTGGYAYPAPRGGSPVTSLPASPVVPPSRDGESRPMSPMVFAPRPDRADGAVSPVSRTVSPAIAEQGKSGTGRRLSKRDKR